MKTKARPMRALIVLLSSWIAFRVVAMSLHGNVMAVREMPQRLSETANGTVAKPLPPKPFTGEPREVGQSRFAFLPSFESPIGSVQPERYRPILPASSRLNPKIASAPVVAPPQLRTDTRSPIVATGDRDAIVAMNAHTSASASGAFASSPPTWGVIPSRTQPKIVLSMPSGEPPKPGDPKGWRFEASAWFIARRAETSQALAPVGQLGGSQAGARLYVSKGNGPFALTVLATTPLGSQGGQFVSTGIALRGRGMGIIAERRFSLNRMTRGATALTAYGGIYDVKLPARLQLEAYAQAGLVDTNPFADGALQVTRRLGEFGPLQFHAGGGIWGGGQTRLNRLDIGPTLNIRVPIRSKMLRISAEWRQRVAGNADPGSGPALSAGLDF